MSSYSRGRRDRSPDANIVKVRGLPYEATAIDMCKYFTDCKIRGGARGVWFCVNDRNLPTGVAFIELNSPRDVDFALRLHKQRMGQRYLEIFEVRKSELDTEIRNGATNEFGFNENRRASLSRDDGYGGRGGGGFGRGGGSMGGGFSYTQRDRSSSPGAKLGPPRNTASEHCVKLRGLPFTASREDVIEFLDDVDVCGGSKGVVFIMESKTKRPSGDCYVEVNEKSDIERAIKLNRKNLGSRYVEVFEANSKDVARAKDKEEDDAAKKNSFKVNLRGLPFKTTENEISKWLSEAAEPVEVEITYERSGRPAGSAYAYFKTEEEARAVAKEMHKRDLGTRYIEVYFEDKYYVDKEKDSKRDKSRSPIRGRRSRSGSESD